MVQITKPEVISEMDLLTVVLELTCGIIHTFKITRSKILFRAFAQI